MRKIAGLAFLLAGVYIARSMWPEGVGYEVFAANYGVVAAGFMIMVGVYALFTTKKQAMEGANAASWERLRGIRSFRLVVETPTSPASKQVLKDGKLVLASRETRLQIENAVELQLRSLGLPLSDERGVPYLLVNVNVLNSAGSNVGFELSLRMHETVTVDRSGYRFNGEVWNSGMVGFCLGVTDDDASKNVLERVEESTKLFALDYLRANPKKRVLQ